MTQIPSWLFFALNGGTGKKLSEENLLIADRIIRSLKQESEAMYWEVEILDKVLKVNRFDDCNMYGHKYD